MTQLKTVGLGFIGGVLAIGCWIGLQLFGLAPVPAPRLGEAGSNAEAQLRDFVMRNPQILVEAQQLAERSKQEAENAAVGRIIASRARDIFEDPDSPVGGNPQGGVSLVEFFDYNCPYCRRVTPTLTEIEKSDSDLRLVYKEWPILGAGSEFAARAALASRQQGLYVEFHQALMQASGKVDEAAVLEVARRIGLDVDRLKQDMQAPEIGRAIQRNQELAQALGIRGTPSFVIGDDMLRGAASADVIRGYISRARGQ
jgi:protein-disulfide isomerase